MRPTADHRKRTRWAVAHTAPKLSFKAHPHMLRQACSYALASKGHDTRALQGLISRHRNIQHIPSGTQSCRRHGSRILGGGTHASNTSSRAKRWRDKERRAALWCCPRLHCSGCDTIATAKHRPSSRQEVDSRHLGGDLRDRPVSSMRVRRGGSPPMKP